MECYEYESFASVPSLDARDKARIYSKITTISIPLVYNMYQIIPLRDASLYLQVVLPSIQMRS